MDEKDLKRIIESRYNSVRAFAIENDIPYTTMRSILERGVMNAKAETIFKICDILGINPESFASNKKKHELKIPTSPLVNKITNKVVQLNVPRKQKVLDFATDQLKEQKNKITSIEKKLYEYKVYEKLSAGTGYGYFGDGNYDTVFYEEELDYDFASWVFGDSMEPTYLNGEVVLIKQTGFDYDGAVYAVEWDGQTYIKKVYREENGLKLVSINKKYKDKFAGWSENPRIIGKIVDHFTPEEY
ncbi:helix-turn-helix transcriptional regulator [Streptococcus halichoeri]|uniref:LexA family transcriptional regulator n=1 Tax=Streptococcus halichoeri TaxID=254785 RepID=UPI001356F445|nr:XRE family transcriptional regulator [Streptococcus halichoeri]